MDGIRRWLADRRSDVVTVPTVGVSIGRLFVAVCLVGPPIRITGLYRVNLDGSPGADLGRQFYAAVRDARRVLRAPVGTTAVLAQPTVDRSVRVVLSAGWGRDRLLVTHGGPVAAGLDQAGFAVAGFDPLPIALARFAACSNQHRGQLTANGWTVTVTSDQVGAEMNRSGRPDDQRHHGVAPTTPTGPDPGAAASDLDLHGVRIPRGLERHLCTETDAAAIGAALREYGFPPDLVAEQEAPPGPEAQNRRGPMQPQRSHRAPARLSVVARPNR